MAPQIKTRRLSRQFEIGDFVLSGHVTRRENKLILHWKGPRRVVPTLNDWTYDIQELVEPFGIITRHVTQLKFFREKDLGVTEDWKAYVVYANGGHLVRSFLDCLLNLDNHQWEVLVQWIRSDDTENSWEPASILVEDVPNLLWKWVADDPKAIGMRTFICSWCCANSLLDTVLRHGTRLNTHQFGSM